MRTFASAVSENDAIFFWAPAPKVSTCWEFAMSICWAKASTWASSSAESESARLGAAGGSTSMMEASAATFRNRRGAGASASQVSGRWGSIPAAYSSASECMAVRTDG